MRTQRRRRPVVLVSLLVSLGLAVALGLISYVAVTSLPYLAVSPTTDSTFGALNACVLERLTERTGYAVSRDLTRLAAWSSKQLVECADGTPPRVEDLSGITSGSYDGQGGLWLGRQAPDAEAAGLLRLAHEGARQEIPTLSAQALVGTASGVVVLEPTGQLVALGATGEVRGTYQLPTSDVRGSQLSSSGDGTRLALILGGGLFAFDASLGLLRAQAPCEVRFGWWRAATHTLMLECAHELTLELEIDGGGSETVPRRARVHSVLAGPRAIWVETCDVLPCTAPEP